ncbi:hypothetical protein K0M31_017957 [Melipona bicolor]|uniref:SGF29 C-terminal domain-containing protein n=1 Tax=Melipona bicolor TaxID=60889 RepID=A0AA40KT08_9HYME|nr:hypothetical protein K0M31_017957 [Melipona bicolor]
MALYPQTTCFYKAVVNQSPTTSTEEYEVLFEDANYASGLLAALKCRSALRDLHQGETYNEFWFSSQKRSSDVNNFSAFQTDKQPAALNIDHFTRSPIVVDREVKEEQGLPLACFSWTPSGLPGF